MDFKEKVLRAAKKIPVGRVASYAWLAGKIGLPKAYRAVARILSGNFDPSVPCHRVIRSNRQLGGYNRGPAHKIAILKKEGVVFDEKGRIAKDFLL